MKRNNRIKRNNRMIHYISSRKNGRQRYENFLNSCVRQLTEVPEKNIKDLIADATNKDGGRMRTGVPPTSGISQVLDRDLQQRFKRVGTGIYALRKKKVIQ